MAGLAPALPLVYDDEDGYRLIKNYRNLATQNLKMLILTVPGERMMDPIFGVGLIRFLFEPSLPATHGSIRAKILEQVRLYLSYIEITDIKISDSSDNDEISENYISVKISYKIKPLELFDELELTVSN